VPGTLVFEEHELSKTFTVGIIQDQVFEYISTYHNKNQAIYPSLYFDPIQPAYNIRPSGSPKPKFATCATLTPAPCGDNTRATSSTASCCVPSTAEPMTTVTIKDDGDAGTIAFAAAEFYALESSGYARVTLTRTGGSSTSCCTDVLLTLETTEAAFAGWRGATPANATRGVDFGPTKELHGNSANNANYSACSAPGKNSEPVSGQAYSNCWTMAAGATSAQLIWPDKVGDSITCTIHCTNATIHKVVELVVDVPILNDRHYEVSEEDVVLLVMLLVVLLGASHADTDARPITCIYRDEKADSRQ
jgi:hypothetical protein